MTFRLRDHQSTGRDLLLSHPRYALFWKPRVGKTITVLAACAAEPMHTIVVAPKAVVGTAWAGDAAYFPSLNFRVLRSKDGTPAKRRAIVKEHFARYGASGIVGMNRELFVSMADYLLRASAPFRLVVDESSCLKNHQTKSFRWFAMVAQKASRVVLLSGTPAPNNGTEYYGQLVCLNAVNGMGFWQWANRYFTPVRREIWTKGKKRRNIVEDWIQTGQQHLAIRATLRTVSSSLRLEDCYDLPPESWQFLDVEMPDDERALYEAAIVSLRVFVKDECGDTVEAGKIKPQALLMKLRQFLTGTVRADGEVYRVGRAKLDALDNLLDEIGPDEPVVIWCEFTGEIDAVRELIHERGEPYMVLDGRNKDSGKDVLRFQDASSGGVRAVCHPLAVGHGVTLNRARYCVFMSASFSAEQHEQARNRIVSHDPNHKRAYYAVRADTEVDHAIWNVLRGKISAADAMLKALGMKGNR